MWCTVESKEQWDGNLHGGNLAPGVTEDRMQSFDVPSRSFDGRSGKDERGSDARRIDDGALSIAGEEFCE